MQLKTKRSSELRDALGGSDRANLEMHLDAEIEWTQRCTWKPWLSEFGDSLGGQERVNWEMHLETVIEHVRRYTSRSWSIKNGGVLGSSWSGESQCGGGESGGGRSGGMCDGSWDCIHWLTRNCRNEEYSVQQGPLRAEKLAGSRIQSILGWCSMRCIQYPVYAVLGVRCTRCTLYLVYAALGVNSWSWHGEIERDDLTSVS